MATQCMSAVDGAKAVNDLSLSSNDRGALLEVFEDYCTSFDPDSTSEDRDDDVEDKLLLECRLQ